MDFSFSAEENAFRDELRTWLRQELGDDFRDTGMQYQKDWSFEREYVKRLAKKGWIVPAWPKEYGGLALGIVKQTIFNEEMTYFGSPHYPLTGNGSDLIGPILMVYGTDEQKREQLPLIASGERVWSQGFSEPNSGSDLASLQCQAVTDGDDFVINGTKIWTTGCHLAEWMFILVRTDPDAPKHRGISFLMFDLKTPGVSIIPLVDMAGQHVINQEFFEDVRVPRRNLVGELNRGWYVAAATLDFERSGIGRVATARRRVDDLVKWAKDTRIGGQRPFDDPIVRRKLTERLIECEAGRYISYRVASMQEAGLIPNQEASMAKILGSETQQRVALTGVEIMGPYGQLRQGHAAPMHGDFPRWYLDTIPETIESGSSEIQRNIIATRGLGLPRM